MCGIVGLAGRTAVPPSFPLLACRDALSHRGPDDAGFYLNEDRTVLLAHRRLAIIDPSPEGHQPMGRSSTLQLAFNGEIYNYRELRDRLREKGHSFRSESDSEVLLAAYEEWDVGCLEHLNGMFAFAIWDANRRRLFLARDRAGEKPLYYRHTPDQLSFASELKALLADPFAPRLVDAEALEFYLAYGYVPAPFCILRGFRKLPPAHALLYDLDRGATRLWRYWEPPQIYRDSGADADDLVDELDRLLFHAVQRQLAAADVPVGILLSGGLDSSLVTAMAARSTVEPVRTFTVTFPGYPAHDEAVFARLVASHFGTSHCELSAGDAPAEMLTLLARQFDEPLADSSMIPVFLVSLLIRRQLSVALGGDGGDELFGGYTHYSRLIRRERLARLLPLDVRQTLATVIRHALPRGAKGRSRVLGLLDERSGLAEMRHYFDPDFRREIRAGSADDSWRSPEEFLLNVAPPDASMLRQVTATEFATYLPEDVLTKVDRASMLASLEVRAPFLDRHVVEFAFGCVPDSLRATETERKVILRRLGERLLPPNLDLRRKQGFTIPLRAWLGGRYRRLVQEVFESADPAIFRRVAILRMLNDQQQMLTPVHEHRIFAILMFELWRREYGATL